MRKNIFNAHFLHLFQYHSYTYNKEESKNIFTVSGATHVYSESPSYISVNLAFLIAIVQPLGLESIWIKTKVTFENEVVFTSLEQIKKSPTLVRINKMKNKEVEKWPKVIPVKFPTTGCGFYEIDLYADVKKDASFDKCHMKTVVMYVD